MLVDAKNKFGNGCLLPAGPLREDLSSIERADKVIVVNKGANLKNALKYCDYLKNKFKKDTYLCKIVPDVAYNIMNGQDISKIICYAQEENIEHIVTTEKDAVKLMDILKGIELPVNIYALKLKAYMDIKEVCGK